MVLKLMYTFAQLKVNQMKKILIGLFCGISLGSIGQNMTLNENSGSSSSYSITDVNKMD